MEYTPINELPAPPAFMLEEAEEAETQYIQDLAQQVMTIKEARVLLLPIIAQAYESPANKVFREALEDYTIEVINNSSSVVRDNIRRNGTAWSIRRFFRGMIYYYDELMPLTTKRYSCEQMKSNVRRFEKKQMDDFCRTKSGKVPACRIRRAYDLRCEWEKRLGMRPVKGIVKENGDWFPAKAWQDQSYGIGCQYRYFKSPSFWVVMDDFKKNKFKESYIYDFGWYHLLTEIGRDPMF